MNALLIQLLMFNRPCIHDQEGSEILINSDSLISSKKNVIVYMTTTVLKAKWTTNAIQLHVN